MDWQAKGGTDRLERIVVLLLSFADLAERTAGRCLPLRWLMMWRLWQADRLARELVAGFLSTAAGTLRESPPSPARHRHGRADALALALSLRALAQTVRTIAARLRHLAFLHPTPAPGDRDPAGPSGLAFLPALTNVEHSPAARPDTS